MAKELGREPRLKGRCYKTHTHNNQWSTLAAEAVYEQYNTLFSDKYKDVESEKQPPFGATLWKMVLDGRDVGVHSGHKQALGGLDPNFHSVTSSSSNIHTTAASTVEAMPQSTQIEIKEYIDSKLTALLQSLEQSISQVIDAVKNKNKVQMLEEEEYKTEMKEALDDHYYEQRRQMKGKRQIRRHRMLDEEEYETKADREEELDEHYYEQRRRIMKEKENIRTLQM